MDASWSSIETQEKRAASQRVQFSVDTKEIHDANERMPNETFLDCDGEASGGDDRDRFASLVHTRTSILSNGNPNEQTKLQRSEVERTDLEVDITIGSAPREFTPRTDEYHNTRQLTKLDAQRRSSQTISSATLTGDRKTTWPAVSYNSSADGAVRGTTDISLSEGFTVAAAASALVAVSASARGSDHMQSTDGAVHKQTTEYLQVSDSEQTHTLPLVASVPPPQQIMESDVQRLSSREVKTQLEFVEGDRGPRPPVLESRTTYFIVGSRDAEGGGQGHVSSTQTHVRHETEQATIETSHAEITQVQQATDQRNVAHSAGAAPQTQTRVHEIEKTAIDFSHADVIQVQRLTNQHNVVDSTGTAPQSTYPLSSPRTTLENRALTTNVGLRDIEVVERHQSIGPSVVASESSDTLCASSDRRIYETQEQLRIKRKPVLPIHSERSRTEESTQSSVEGSSIVLQSISASSTASTQGRASASNAGRSEDTEYHAQQFESDPFRLHSGATSDASDPRTRRKYQVPLSKYLLPESDADIRLVASIEREDDDDRTTSHKLRGPIIREDEVCGQDKGVKVADTSTGTVDSCTAITARSRNFSTEPRRHVENMDNEHDHISHESSVTDLDVTIIQQSKAYIVNAKEEVAVHDRTSQQVSLVNLSKSRGSTTSGISSTMISGDVGSHTDCSAESASVIQTSRIESTEDRRQTDRAAHVRAEPGAFVPVPSESIPSPIYSTYNFGSDVRTSVSTAQTTGADRSNVVLSTGKQSPGGHMDASLSIQIRERTATSESMQSAMVTEEIHGGNESMTSETFLALGSGGRDGEASGGGGRVASFSRKSISTSSSGNQSQITVGIERQSSRTDEQTILQHSAVERTGMNVDVTTGSSPLETTSPTKEFPNARRPSKVDAQHHRSQTISNATLSSERMMPSSAALNSSAGGAVHGTTAISLAEGFAIATAASALVVASDAGEKVSARDSAQSTGRTGREQAIEEAQVSVPEQMHTLSLVPSAKTSLQTKEQVTSHVQRVSSREVKTQLESVGDESGQTTSKFAQFTVGTEETHSSNEPAMRKTSSRLAYSDCNEEALGSDDRDRSDSLPRQGVALQTSVGIERQFSESDEESTLEWSEAEGREVDVHIAIGLAPLEPTPQIEETASQQLIAVSRTSLEHQIVVPDSIPPTSHTEPMRVVLGPIAKKTASPTPMIDEGTNRSQGTDSGQSQPRIDTLTEMLRDTNLPPSNATPPHDDEISSQELSEHERELTYGEHSRVSRRHDFNTQGIDSLTGSLAVESLAVHSSGSAPIDEKSSTLSPLLTRPPISAQRGSVVGVLSISHNDAAGRSSLPDPVVTIPSQAAETDNSVHRMNLVIDQSRVVGQQEVSMESDGTPSPDFHHQELAGSSSLITSVTDRSVIRICQYQNTYSFAPNSRVKDRSLASVLPSDGARLHRGSPVRVTTPGLVDHLVESTSVSFNETSENFVHGEEYDVGQHAEAPPISPPHHNQDHPETAQSPVSEHPSPAVVLDQTVAESELRVGYAYVERQGDIASYKSMGAAPLSEDSPSFSPKPASPDGSQESQVDLHASGNIVGSSTVYHGSDAYEMGSRHTRGRGLSTALDLSSAGAISRTLLSDPPKAQLVSPSESAHDALTGIPSGFSESDTNHADNEHCSDASRLTNDEVCSQEVSRLSGLSSESNSDSDSESETHYATESFQLRASSEARCAGTTLSSNNRYSVEFRDNSNSSTISRLPGCRSQRNSLIHQNPTWLTRRCHLPRVVLLQLRATKQRLFLLRPPPLLNIPCVWRPTLPRRLLSH
ncbi:hypothetical protein BDN67DRAFT_132125 [Paxillus ammoniavirescens]|nr:hypothetical protein BDN67DRAFT_132125 [Paxillus ammoniavirescens]